MLNAARRLAARGDWCALAAKVTNAPREDSPHHAQFVDEVKALTAALAEVGDYHAGAAVRRAHERLRLRINFMHRDRAMDGDVRTICELVASGALLDGAG
jgi:histidine ammonia-lyase